MYNEIVNEVEYTEKIVDSKFLGYVYKILTKNEGYGKIEKVKKMHPKATHVCWAMRYLDQDTGQLYYYFDDAGEPSGTAGKPILKVLSNRGLVNLICIVVRYFGGTKLGKGGLIRAYSNITTRTVEKAGITAYEKIIKDCFYVGYKELPNIVNILRSNNLDYNLDYKEDVVKITTEIKESLYKKLKNKLSVLSK